MILQSGRLHSLNSLVVFNWISLMRLAGYGGIRVWGRCVAYGMACFYKGIVTEGNSRYRAKLPDGVNSWFNYGQAALPSGGVVRSEAICHSS